MANFLTVCRKELGDQLGSKRYILLFILVIMLSTMSAYQGASFIRNNPNASFSSIFSGSPAGFSFVTLMVFFGPIIGLALGFDAINKERSTGSLSVLLSQPIFRDSILNGKFLAGVASLALMTASTVGIMVGVSIPLLGFGPSGADLTRIAFFALFTLLYLAFWLSLSLLFSTAIKKTTSSILAAISTWLFCVFIVSIMASVVASAAVPVSMPTGFTAMSGGGIARFNEGGTNQTGPSTIIFTQNMTIDFGRQMQDRAALESAIQSISPSYLFSEAASAILGGGSSSNVLGFIGSTSGAPFRGPGAGQSAASSWPQVTAIAVGMVICFVAAYMLFLRREIRAGG
ncbi:MAG: ABC transporter permease [Candidatus Bathyarchaeia archaeon]